MSRKALIAACAVGLLTLVALAALLVAQRALEHADQANTRLFAHLVAKP